MQKPQGTVRFIEDTEIAVASKDLSKIVLHHPVAILAGAEPLVASALDLDVSDLELATRDVDRVVLDLDELTVDDRAVGAEIAVEGVGGGAHEDRPLDAERCANHVERILG